jgi:hypothetical protein
MIGSEYNPLVEHFPSLAKYMPDGAGSYAGGTEPAILTVDIDGQPVRLAIMVCLEDVVPSSRPRAGRARSRRAHQPHQRHLVRLRRRAVPARGAGPLPRDRGRRAAGARGQHRPVVDDRSRRRVPRAHRRRRGRRPHHDDGHDHDRPPRPARCTRWPAALTWGAALAAIGWWLGPASSPASAAAAARPDHAARHREPPLRGAGVGAGRAARAAGVAVCAAQGRHPQPRRRSLGAVRAGHPRRHRRRLRDHVPRGLLAAELTADHARAARRSTRPASRWPGLGARRPRGARRSRRWPRRWRTSTATAPTASARAACSSPPSWPIAPGSTRCRGPSGSRPGSRGHGLEPDAVLDPASRAGTARCGTPPGATSPGSPARTRADARAGDGAPPRALSAPPGPPVFVIGLSYMPRVYLDALAYLAEARPVTVLRDVAVRAVLGRRAAAPRRVAAPRSPPTSRSRSALGQPRPRHPGGAGRAVRRRHRRSLRRPRRRARRPTPAPARAGPTTRCCARAPAGGHAPAAAPRAPAPAGVQILACPSPVRELEVVAAEIRARLERDPSLTANQIAVLLAPSAVETYLPQIAPAFARYQLPFHVVDIPALGHGHAAAAMELLLALPLGRFRRPELLGVMTHPAVLARHPGVDPHDWLAWTEALGIVHGADDADHAGTYLAGKDAFHWDQGIKRLALGAFMAGPRAGADLVATLEGRVYRPEEVAADEQASAATFALLARSLIADARWLRGHRAPLDRPGPASSTISPPRTWAARTRPRSASWRGSAPRWRPRRARPRRPRPRLRRGRRGGPPPPRSGSRRPRRAAGPRRPRRAHHAAPPAAVRPHLRGRPRRGRLPVERSPGRPRAARQLRRGDVSARDRDRYAFLELALAAARRAGPVVRRSRAGHRRAAGARVGGPRAGRDAGAVPRRRAHRGAGALTRQGAAAPLRRRRRSAGRARALRRRAAPHPRRRRPGARSSGCHRRGR